MAEKSSTELSSTSGSRSSTANKKRKNRKSSVFRNARLSLARTGGKTGASVETLRGTSGSDFEALGIVHRGAGGGGCFDCMCGGTRESTKERLLLIKGPFCFVFSDEESLSPKYAIGLQHMSAEVKPPRVGGRIPVLLETSLGDVEYEISFDSEELAKQFKTVVIQQSRAAEAEEARKRLGHEHLLNKRGSLRYAESVAKKKVKDQPDAPITGDEIMKNMPVVEPMY